MCVSHRYHILVKFAEGIHKVYEKSSGQQKQQSLHKDYEQIGIFWTWFGNKNLDCIS